MNILITGAAGGVGSTLAYKIKKQGLFDNFNK